jgi:hypothetical protein
MQALYTASRFFMAAWSGTSCRACIMHVSMAEYLPLPGPISLWAHALDTEPSAATASNARAIFFHMFISLFDPTYPGRLHDSDGGLFVDFKRQ